MRAQIVATLGRKILRPYVIAFGAMGLRRAQSVAPLPIIIPKGIVIALLQAVQTCGFVITWRVYVARAQGVAPLRVPFVDIIMLWARYTPTGCSDLVILSLRKHFGVHADWLCMCGLDGK